MTLEGSIQVMKLQGMDYTKVEPSGYDTRNERKYSSIGLPQLFTRDPSYRTHGFYPYPKRWWSDVGFPQHFTRTGVDNNQGHCAKGKSWWPGAVRRQIRAKVYHTTWDYIDDEHWWSGVGLLQRFTKANVYLTHGDYIDVFNCQLPTPSPFSTNGHGSETIYCKDRPKYLVMTSKGDNVLVARCTKNPQSTETDNRKGSGNRTEETNRGSYGKSTIQPVTIDHGWIEKYQFDDISVAQHLKKSGFYGNSSVTKYLPCKLLKYCQFNITKLIFGTTRFTEEYQSDVTFTKPIVKTRFYSSVAKYFACKLSNYYQLITRQNPFITTKSSFYSSLERHMEKYQFHVNDTQFLPNVGFYSSSAKFFTYCQVNSETSDNESLGKKQQTNFCNTILEPWSPKVSSDTDRNSATHDDYNFPNVAMKTSDSSCESHQELYSSDINRNVAPVEDPVLHSPKNAVISTPETLDASMDKSTTIGQEYFTDGALVS